MVRCSGSVCVGRKDNEYYFVGSVFDHGDGFQGCTGYVVRPVSAGEFVWANSWDALEERLWDVWSGEFRNSASVYCAECEGILDEDNGCDNCDIPCLRDFVESVAYEDGVDTVMFDPSYRCEACEAFDGLGVEYESTDCTGGGRIFDKIDFDEIYNHEACEAVKAFEAGEVSYDHAVATIFS